MTPQNALKVCIPLYVRVLAIKLNRAPANKKELVQDLIVKAKQIEYLIQSLPVPEPEEQQVRRCGACVLVWVIYI
jgi:hypothetical protein